MTITKSNLQLYWSAPLQTAEGVPVATRVTDFSGHARHGTVSNVSLTGGQFVFPPVLNSSPPGWITSSMAAPSVPYTIAYRVTPRANWAGGYYQTLYAAINSQAAHYINTDGTFAGIHSGGHTNVSGSPSWSIGTEYVVIYTFDGTTLRVYRDDGTTPVGSSTPGATPGGNTFMFGQNGNASSGWEFTAFRGDAEAIAYWDRVLDATERAAVISDLGSAINDPVPVVVGVRTVAGGTGAQTFTAHPDAGVGDLAIMVLETAYGETITASGWTQYAALNSAGTSNRLTVLYRILTGSDTYTTSDSGDHQVGAVVWLKAGTFNPSNPFNASQQSTHADATSFTLTGTTTTVDNCRVLVAVSGGRDIGTPQWTSWSPGSEIADVHTTAGDGGGVGIATFGQAAAGATGNIALTAAQSATLAALVLAIAPPVTALELTGVADTDSRGTMAFAGALPLAAQDDSNTTGTVALAGTVGLSGVSDTDASGAYVLSGAVPLGGHDDAEAIGSVALISALALDGVSDTDDVGTVTLIVAAGIALTGVDDAEASGTVVLTANIALAGVSNDDTAGSLVTSGDLPVAGVADADAVGGVALSGGSPLYGVDDGDTSGTVVLLAGDSIALAGVVDTDTTGALALTGVLDLTGVADSNTTGSLDVLGPSSLLLDGVADVDTSGDVVLSGTVAINGGTDADEAGALELAGAVPLTGASDTDVAGELTLTGSDTVLLDGATDADASGLVAIAGALPLAGASDSDQPGTWALSGRQALTGAVDDDTPGTVAFAASITLTGAADGDDAGTVDVVTRQAIALGGVTDGDTTGTLAFVGWLPLTGSTDDELVGAVLVTSGGVVELDGTADADSSGTLALAGSVSLFGAIDPEQIGSIITALALFPLIWGEPRVRALVSAPPTSTLLVVETDP